MRRSAIVLLVALAGAAAAGPAPHPRKITETVQPAPMLRETDAPPPRPDYSDELAARVRDAIAHRDAKALVADLAAPLSYGGMPADRPACKRFGRRGLVKRAADLPAFAACLVDAAHGLTVLGHAFDWDHGDVPPRSLNVFADRDADHTTSLFISPPPSKPAPPPSDVDRYAHPPDDDEPAGPAVPRSKKPIELASDFLDHALIAGDRHVVPDAATRAAIARAGGHATAALQACFGEDGVIDRVRVVAPSGIAAYDRALAAAVGAYRIKPVEQDDDGRVPVCTTYTFTYPSVR